jgi:hypothetical protein
VTIPTTVDVLALDSSRTVRAATMVRIEAPIRYIHEILLTTGQRSKTSTCRAASILFQQRLVQNGCEGDFCCQLNRAHSMSSNNLLKAVLIRHGKLFQQSSRKTMMLCPCTDNCTVAHCTQQRKAVSHAMNISPRWNTE